MARARPAAGDPAANPRLRWRDRTAGGAARLAAGVPGARTHIGQHMCLISVFSVDLGDLRHLRCLIN